MHYATVIVAIVVIEDDKVLLVQEAKEDCRGQWYLPAGRVEKGESLLEGARRETEEESGLELEPTGIFSVEYSADSRTDWIRFGITGKIIGGRLKSEREQDRESIQAQWFSLNGLHKIDLRSRDILSLIDQCQKGVFLPIANI
mmetsp:Transcript_14052/g.24102  ORF Transcript_14052/g.24102 Transcript_14052/m.24102 type:complete len:143 (+) Transcript_14052:135-563(+)